VKGPALPKPVEASFARRAARAEALTATASSSEEPLRFAAGLYRAQARVAVAIAALHAERPLTGRLGQDVDRFAEALRDLLRFAADNGPAGLADEARTRASEERSLMCARMLPWWGGDRGSSEDYLSRALLRPYGEVLASVNVAPDRPRRPRFCPFCGGAPWVAARREQAEGDGVQRLLGCALCGGEWAFERISCPCCAEGDPVKLPVFQTESYPAARIEACETCRRYVKCIDLTRDARAIPEVDDLVSLGLDLWAGKEGFLRIESGLAGI
jgi:formate dehydrogenase maturation protein FdhE